VSFGLRALLSPLSLSLESLRCFASLLTSYSIRRSTHFGVDFYSSPSSNNLEISILYLYVRIKESKSNWIFSSFFSHLALVRSVSHLIPDLQEGWDTTGSFNYDWFHNTKLLEKRVYQSWGCLSWDWFWLTTTMLLSTSLQSVEIELNWSTEACELVSSYWTDLLRDQLEERTQWQWLLLRFRWLWWSSECWCRTTQALEVDELRCWRM